jgi:hypothetical protein
MAVLVQGGRYLLPLNLSPYSARHVVNACPFTSLLSSYCLVLDRRSLKGSYILDHGTVIQKGTIRQLFGQNIIEEKVLRLIYLLYIVYTHVLFYVQGACNHTPRLLNIKTDDHRS